MTVIGVSQTDRDARGEAARSDSGDAPIEQYERQLAERLALLLAAEFHRRLEERQLKERRDD